MTVNLITSGRTLEQDQLRLITRAFIITEARNLPFWNLIKSPDVFLKMAVTGKLNSAKFVADLEVSKGTTGARDADGKPTGNNFNNVDRYENIGGLENINAPLTIAWQDRNLLLNEVDALQSIYNDFKGGLINNAILSERMLRLSYGQRIKDVMVAKIKQDISTALVTFLVASETDNIFDTEKMFKTAAGSLFANINVISAAFSEASLETLINLSTTQVNQNGIRVGTSFIKHIIIDDTLAATFVKINSPDKIENTLSRTIIEALKNGQINTVPLPLGASRVFALMDGHGLKALCEFDDVDVKMTFDENSSISIQADFNIGFMWVNGISAFEFKP
jgi:hypothetical protein